MAPFAAPDAPIDDLSVDEIEKIVVVRVDQVEMGERLREVDPVWAEALGTMMKRDGQRDPIDIRRLPGQKTWTLGGAGGHRLTGARVAGMAYIKARIVTADRAESRMREVQDNLQRRDLDPIDRAAFVAELVALHKQRAGLDPEKDGRSASVAARWQKAVRDEAADTTATIAVVYGWSEAVGSAIGLSERTIRNDLTLYRRLAPSLIAKLRAARHPVLGNATQLRALARLGEADQDAVVTLLLRDRPDKPAAKSVADAIAQLRGSNRAVDPEAKRLSTLIGTFARMGLAEKKAALFQLGGMLPAGFAIVEGEQRPGTPAFPAEHERYRDETLAAIDAVREQIDGLEEDEAIPGDRGAALYDAGVRLAVARLTIAGNGFDLGGTA